MLALLFAVLALAHPPVDPLDAAMARFAALNAYRVTLRAEHGAQREVIAYRYKKPGLIRMDFFHPHAGASLVYDPATALVRVRPFSALPGFTFSLRPDSPLVKSPQGHRMDQSDLGALLARAAELRRLGRLETVDQPDPAGEDALVVDIRGDDGAQVEGVNRYRLWLARRSGLPVRAQAFAPDQSLREDVRLEGLEIDPPLDERTFILPDAKTPSPPGARPTGRPEPDRPTP